MSYDSTITHKLLQAAPVHARMPNAEYITELHSQLKSAEAHMEILSKESRDARSDFSEADRQLKQEERLHRETRQQLAELKQKLATLEAKPEEEKKPQAGDVGDVPVALGTGKKLRVKTPSAK